MADRRVWLAGALAVAFGLGIATGAVGLRARQTGVFVGTPLGEPPSTSCARADPIAFVEPEAHRGPFDSIVLPDLATTPPLNEEGAPLDPTGLHIHPGGTAVFGIAYLNLGDEAMAIKMARALIAAGELDGDKLWFPHRFPFDVTPWHLGSGWRSGFAQGFSLAFLVRLWEATGDAAYRHAADAIFRTLLPGEGVSRLDGQDFWIEEYPTTPADTVYNGHVYAILGLYEYDRVVGSPRARELALQGIETLRRHVPEIVMADGAAYYDAGRFQGKISASYRVVYIELFSWLAAITNEPCFRDVARALAGPLGGRLGMD